MTRRTRDSQQSLIQLMKRLIFVMAAICLSSAAALWALGIPVQAADTETSPPSPSATPAIDDDALVPLPSPIPSSNPQPTPESIKESAPTPLPTDSQPISQNPFVQLAMEDQYHSQVSETHLPNTCGPTALLMVLDYLGLENALETVIAQSSIPPLEGGYDPYCAANPVCTSPGTLARIASETYGLEVTAHEGWTLELVYESLVNGHPIIADISIKSTDEGPGHFVVIYGIDLSENQVTYHDPYLGAARVAQWEDFAQAWDGPVDVGDPLQPEGHTFWGMVVKQPEA